MLLPNWSRGVCGLNTGSVNPMFSAAGQQFGIRQQHQKLVKSRMAFMMLALYVFTTTAALLGYAHEDADLFGMNLFLTYAGGNDFGVLFFA